MAYMVTLLNGLLLTLAWQHNTCLACPQAPRLWHKGVELNLRRLTVKEGTTLSVVCDGFCGGGYFNPLLRWYGKNGGWISQDGPGKRVYTEASASSRWRQLVILGVVTSDAGVYTCRSWNIKKLRFTEAHIRIKVDTAPPALRANTSTTTTTEATTTTTAAKTTTVISTTKAQTPRVTTTMEIETTENTSYIGGGCADTQFECDDGKCWDLSYRCDSFPECADNTDELNCGPKSCEEGLVLCKDGSSCFSTTVACNGIDDCQDGTDESPEICGV